MKRIFLFALALLIPTTTSMIHADSGDAAIVALSGASVAGFGLYGLYKLGQGLRSTNKHVRATSKAISSLVCAGSALATACACGEFMDAARFGNSLEYSNNRNFVIGFGIASAISVFGSCLFSESAIQDITTR